MTKVGKQPGMESARNPLEKPLQFILCVFAAGLIASCVSNQIYRLVLDRDWFSGPHPADWQIFRATVALLFAITCALKIGAVHFRLRLKPMPPKLVPNKSAAIEQAVEMEFALPAPLAWRALKDALDQILVRTPNIRPTVWLTSSVDEGHQKMELSLNYQRQTMGNRIYRLYPRSINLRIQLRGRGTRSSITLAYDVRSPMDYQNTCAIIQFTNRTIKGVLDATVSVHRQAA
jgi:hypothetical protein